jgi:hypothetical protein
MTDRQLRDIFQAGLQRRRFERLAWWLIAGSVVAGIMYGMVVQ